MSIMQCASLKKQRMSVSMKRIEGMQRGNRKVTTLKYQYNAIFKNQGGPRPKVLRFKIR